MTAGLETFAKVRALHDGTIFAGERAAAATRMEALARGLGMTVDEALSKLDRATAQPEPGVDWAAFEEALRRAGRSKGAKAEWPKGAAADAPEATCWRRGLPIYNPDKIEPWRDVAEHCLQLDWIIPKAHGGKFLTKDERARLKVIARQYCPITNATADWIETVLARCEAARQSWRDRGKAGVRPDRKATESDIEKAAELVAAARRREASKPDAPDPESEFEPEPQTAAQAAAESFAEFMNRPEFVAERNEREARRRVEAAAIIERYGSEDALFEDTPMEAALRAACEPLLGPGETWSTSYSLDGWGSLGTGATMPASVRTAVSLGWPLPETVTEAWVECEAADRLMGERCTVEYAYEPHLYVQARRNVVEEICNALPARSLNDLRARGEWLAFQADAEVSQRPGEHRTLIATLRADIERMAVQFGQPAEAGTQAPDRQGEPVQSKHGEGVHQPAYPSRRTTAEKRRDVLALLNTEHVGAAPLTDREIARRVGVSPTTVGTIRRAGGVAG